MIRCGWEAECELQLSAARENKTTNRPARPTLMSSPPNFLVPPRAAINPPPAVLASFSRTSTECGIGFRFRMRRGRAGRARGVRQRRDGRSLEERARTRGSPSISPCRKAIRVAQVFSKMRRGNTAGDQLPVPTHRASCHDISVSSPTFSLEISVRRDVPRSERHRRLSECEDGEDGEEDEEGGRRHSCSLYSRCDFGVCSFFVLQVYRHDGLD